ncbi:hypothetical protein ACLSY3_02755 [Avibacterium avium]|uniref:hypothetical protein n=1 Tax=Avibacterium avium TaxID=751 RepID=UPI003BF7F284
MSKSSSKFDFFFIIFIIAFCVFFTSCLFIIFIQSDYLAGLKEELLSKYIIPNLAYPVPIEYIFSSSLFICVTFIFTYFFIYFIKIISFVFKCLGGFFTKKITRYIFILFIEKCFIHLDDNDKKYIFDTIDKLKLNDSKSDI